ncbi:MAG: lipopolysaccharide heptosyltransferase I [Burkholderiales bacterium]
MTRILLVRLSSLGDVLHTFPAATDLRRAMPDAALDWVVEEAYAPLVRMHPGVSRAIPFALRRWRHDLLSRGVRGEFSAFRAQLREHPYDAIVDAQGLVKSAVVARLAHGPVHGYGPATARERLAARLYRFTHEIPPEDHAVHRYRTLLARALDYRLQGGIDYGIVPPPAPVFAPSEPYCVLLHSTARPEKLWREEAWLEVGRALASRRLACVLPWGNLDERRRAKRLGEALPQAVVPPQLSMDEAAGLIGDAVAVVGLDTGLMHLAVALGVPVVGIYCSSEPARTGPLGPGRIAIRGGAGRPPSPAEVLDALGEVAPALA